MTAGRITRAEVERAAREVAASIAQRAELEWAGYIKAKVPGVRGHSVFYPRGYDASSSSAIASWAARTAGRLIAEGATIVSVGMTAEVRS